MLTTLRAYAGLQELAFALEKASLQATTIRYKLRILILYLKGQSPEIVEPLFFLAYNTSSGAPYQQVKTYIVNVLKKCEKLRLSVIEETQRSI